MAGFITRNLLENNENIISRWPSPRVTTTLIIRFSDYTGETMPKRQVFYSFHFDNDVMRVQQIRNMGVIDGDEPVSKNEWEQLKKTAGGVQKWINDNMRYRSCVIVLVGAQTSGRPWVQYEIKKAWNEGKGLFGIYIHNLNDPNTGTSNRGLDPFSQFTLKKTDGSSVRIPVYDPIANNAYNEIKNNIDHWSEIALVATANRQPLT
jgi:MTH538 TIR-like domain (DUF1863)